MLHSTTSNSSKKGRRKQIDMEKMQNQNQSVHFVLSTDAKPRLKWTPELHLRFIEAVNQLGGAEKATPKSLMRAMRIPGLTLYHLKSHLQKYRLGKSQQLETCSDNKQQGNYREIKSSDGGHCSKENSVGAQKQITENVKMARALQMQMEAQRKLHDQIEVQKHLQLRIEAQGEYLQSVLKKAREALAGYNSSTIVGLELTKAELSQLVTIINNACPSSPISELTETRGGLSLKSNEERKQDKGTMCSLESSLTSSESCGRKEEEKEPMEEEIIGDFKNSNTKASFGESRNEGGGRKRKASDKRCANNLRKPELSEMLDLNRKYHISDTDSSSKTTIDLNCSSSFWEP